MSAINLEYRINLEHNNIVDEIKNTLKDYDPMKDCVSMSRDFSVNGLNGISFDGVKKQKVIVNIKKPILVPCPRLHYEFYTTLSYTISSNQKSEKEATVEIGLNGPYPIRGSNKPNIMDMEIEQKIGGILYSNGYQEVPENGRKIYKKELKVF